MSAELEHQHMETMSAVLAVMPDVMVNGPMTM
jgi:hypothetical protein